MKSEAKFNFQSRNFLKSSSFNSLDNYVVHSTMIFGDGFDEDLLEDSFSSKTVSRRHPEKVIGVNLNI